MHIHTSDQEQMNLGVGACSCNWGTHICGLYDSDEEKENIIYGFLGEGLADGDRMFHVTQKEPSRFRKEFADRWDGWKEAIEDPDRLGIADPLPLYCPDGRFNSDRMVASLVGKFEASQAAGPVHLRSIGDMGWATAKIPGIEQLMDYESRLNVVVAGKPWVTVCLYDVRRFSGAMVLSVLQTHPVVICGGVIMRNPFHLQPEAWLSKNAPHPN